MTTHLAALLRRFRVQQGLTLQAASRAAKITRSYLSDLEHGRNAPNVAVLDRLLSVYGQRLTIVDERIADILGPSPRLLDEV